MLRAALPLAASLLLAASACSGPADAPATTIPIPADKNTAAPAPATAGPALVAAPVAVDGVTTWTASTDAGFTISVPTGDDWTSERTDITKLHSEKLGVTIMLQHQSGIEADQLDDFVTMVRDSNKRDAPKYSDRPAEKGTLAGQPAARLDGEFDNGKAYATRDYLVIGPKGASAVMVRGPKTDAARVQAIADHLAATYAP